MCFEQKKSDAIETASNLGAELSQLVRNFTQMSSEEREAFIGGIRRNALCFTPSHDVADVLQRIDMRITDKQNEANAVAGQTTPIPRELEVA